VATTESRLVELALEIPITEVEATIEGTSCLITHKFDEKMKGEIRDKQTKQQQESKKKRIRQPEAEFNAARYLVTDPETGEEFDAFPAVGLKKALLEAGYRFLGRNKTDTRADLMIPTEFLRIDSPPPEMREDVVRLSGMSRSADLRYRPEYWPWSMQVPIQFNHERMSIEELMQMLAHAGFSVGLGEWRPERDGDHGRFKVSGVTQGG
jgi:hypothetical protein